MALWFSLNINNDEIGIFTAQRREETVPADRICTYDVRVTNGDEQKRTVVRHNFDAGAWALVRTALAELQAIRPEPADTEGAEK